MCYEPSTFNVRALEIRFRFKTKKCTWKGERTGIRSRGFSVLGDSDYSPLVADRVVDVLKMFVDHDVIMLGDVLIRLGIKPAEQQFDWLQGLENKGKQDEKDREIRRLKRELQCARANTLWIKHLADYLK